MDPSGSIYEQDGIIYRKINPPFISFFSSLMGNKTILSMIGNEFVSSAIFSKASEKSFTLRHQKISPVNYAYEWPAFMLQDAARLTLEICIKILDEGYILKDATPWNVVYDSGKPFFVDFTSIMPIDPELIWVALDQFNRLFLFPLLAIEQGFGRVCRSLMLSSQQGITNFEVGKFLPAFLWIKKPWLIKRLYIPRLIISLLQNSGQDKEIGKYIKKAEILPEIRKKFLIKLLSDLNTIYIEIGKSSWSKYYLDIETFFNPQSFNQKQKVISSLLEELKPKSVTDIGCNMGGYSVLAAKQGASVTAFDTDEDSVNMLYRLVKERNLKILPLVMDVTNPSPATGWRSVQHLSACDRFRSEGAFALALSHHLSITQGQSFDRIVEELSDYCEKWLITEFIPIEDPRVKELLLTFRRDLSWYSLEGFIEALGSQFKEISTYESFPSGRTLILCKKK